MQNGFKAEQAHAQAWHCGKTGQKMLDFSVFVQFPAMKQAYY